MYCKKCGRELREGAKFCAVCGEAVNPTVKPTVRAAVGTTVNAAPAGSQAYSVDRTPMYISLITAVLTLVSPFLNLFHVDLDILGKENFSPVKLLEILKNLSDEVGSYNDGTGDIIVPLSYVILIMYILLFLLTVVSIARCLQNISAVDAETEMKYYRNAYGANLGLVIANFITFLILVGMNLIVTTELESERFIWLFGAEIAFYIIEIVGLVGYIAAHGKYRACKKSVRTNGYANGFGVK